MTRTRKLECTLKVLYIAVPFVVLVAVESVDGLFTSSDIKTFQCQDGWVGELPQNYNESMAECDRDKSAPLECRKHCLARRMGLIYEGKVWLYKLMDVMKRLYPGAAGKDSADKMTDVILDCFDDQYKASGPLSLYHCYREKKMWTCISKAAEAICVSNRKRNQEKIKERKKHMDAIVEEDGKHSEKARGKQVVLMDY